jgi:hypothetical protein
LIAADELRGWVVVINEQQEKRERREERMV